MQRTPRQQRLLEDLCAAAVDLQALAQRLANGTDVSRPLREHAEALAQAGRAVALAAVTANDGHNPQTLILFYGQFLTTSPRLRDKLCALDEAGFIPKGKDDHPQSAASLAKRRTAALRTGEPVPSPS